MPDADLSKAFAIVLKKRREHMRLSQEMLAEKADLHPTYISMLERNVRNPTLAAANSIAKALALKYSERLNSASLSNTISFSDLSKMAIGPTKPASRCEFVPALRLREVAKSSC